MITSSDIRKIIDSTWQVDCPLIKVYSIEDDELIDEFSGEIWQDENGMLMLKGLKNGSTSLLGNLLGWTESKPGKLISAKYRLEALPYNSGTPWTSQVHVFNGSRDMTGTSGSVIRARLHTVLRANTLPKKKNGADSASIVINSVDKFPSVIPQEYTTKEVGSTVIMATFDTSEISVAGLQLFFTHDNSVLRVNIRNDESSRSISEMKASNAILDGVQFILGKRLHILVEETRVDDTEATEVYSVGRTPQRSVLTPINSIERNRDCLNLLEIFLQYLLAPENKMSRLPYITRSVLDSASASLEARCLTLSVGIESIVNNILYSKVPTEGTFSKKEVGEIKKQALSCISDTGKRKRVEGLVGMLNTVRAKDILNRLGQDGLIDKSLVKSWDKIRHKAAHGELLIKSGEIQEYADHLCNMFTLYYQLIFLVIGYEGAYTDYSDGFVRKVFEKQLRESKK